MFRIGDEPPPDRSADHRAERELPPVELSGVIKQGVEAVDNLLEIAFSGGFVLGAAGIGWLIVSLILHAVL